MHNDLIRESSAWSMSQIELYLTRTEIPVRLACLSGNGAPSICSLWYLYEDGAIWCATPGTARIVSWLEREPSCGFEIAGDAMPYHGVRGRGEASLSTDDGPDILLRLIDRYLYRRDSEFARWLISRSEGEVSIRIEPDWITSWDFSARMDI